MRSKISFLIPFLSCAFISSAQYSVPTINLNRNFNEWSDSGFSCGSSMESVYWYLFKNEINIEVKQEVRLCGGSVLYNGVLNGLHLYNQSINVTCDSIGSILQKDDNFINLLPLIAEEKISYNIYRDSGLYYVDSSNLTFAADVFLNVELDASIYNFILTCVDSIDSTGNNVLVYGTRNEVIEIASDNRIKKITDRPEEGPVISRQTRITSKIINNNSLVIPGVFNLAGKIIKKNNTSNISISKGNKYITLPRVITPIDKE